MKKFRTHYNSADFPKRYERVDNTSFVERSGYIPAKIRIENMILAGQRLIEARNEQYDFTGEVDEEFADPTRSKGFDLVDAQRIAERLAEKVKAYEQKLAEQKERAHEEKLRQKFLKEQEDKPSVQKTV